MVERPVVERPIVAERPVVEPEVKKEPEKKEPEVKRKRWWHLLQLGRTCGGETTGTCSRTETGRS